MLKLVLVASVPKYTWQLEHSRTVHRTPFFAISAGSLRPVASEIGADGAMLPPIMAFALRHGVSETQIKRAVNQPSNLSQTGRRVSAAAFIELLGLLRDANPTMAVSLEVSELVVTSFGEGLAFSAQFAPNVRAALGLFARFGTLIVDGFRLQIAQSAGTAVLTASHSLNEIDNGRFIEMIIASVWRLVQTNIEERVSPLQTLIHASRREFHDAYHDFFGAPISFVQDRRDTVLVLPAWVLDTPMRLQCRPVFEVMTEGHALQVQCLAGDERSSELACLEDAAADNARRGVYDVTTLAKTAGLSVRTAQRLAARSNVTLRDFLNRARMNTAKKRLLEEPQLTIAELAEALNYSDDRSFRRAFKRYTGSSPASFRREHTAEP